MTLQNSNFYCSPLFSDGDLLLRAKQFRKELESLWEELESLKNYGGCLTEIKQKFHRAEVVANELQKVLEALEENCYDCSGYIF
ncbi:hypothetical protein ACVV7M_004386 [Vibrio vulnificus]|uniref:Uncharacterized protein n=1 Tax=Vibrio cholerae TaxID=666 RepID=A0A5B1BX43_VIBCL